jgi:hypothetical protein
LLYCCTAVLLYCCIATFVLIYLPLNVCTRTRWLYLSSVDTLKIPRVQQISYGTQLTTYLNPLPNCASIPPYAFLVNHRHTRRCRSTGLTWVWTLVLAVQKHTFDLCCYCGVFLYSVCQFTNEQTALLVLYQLVHVSATRILCTGESVVAECQQCAWQYGS